jgi:hypothetical protein
MLLLPPKKLSWRTAMIAWGFNLPTGLRSLYRSREVHLISSCRIAGQPQPDATCETKTRRPRKSDEDTSCRIVGQPQPEAQAQAQSQPQSQAPSPPLSVIPSAAATNTMVNQPEQHLDQTKKVQRSESRGEEEHHLPSPSLR